VKRVLLFVFLSSLAMAAKEHTVVPGSPGTMHPNPRIEALRHSHENFPINIVIPARREKDEKISDPTISGFEIVSEDEIVVDVKGLV